MTSALHCSFFAHAKDNQPRLWGGEWPKLKAQLQAPRYPQAGLTGDDAKKSLPAISGTRFKEGATRSREAALELGLLIFDIDNSQELATGEKYPSGRPKTRKAMIDAPVTFDEAQAAMSAAGVESVTWSTWSAAPDWPKFRIVIPLERAIPADKWEAATERAIDLLGFRPLQRGIDMPVLRDTARLNFLPGSPDPSSIRFGETSGQLLSVPLGGLSAAPSLPVADWQRAIQAERKAQRDAKKYWFQRYEMNGRPVVFKTLDLADVMAKRGYRPGPPRPFGSGQKWRCHCPWASEHSNGIDDDSAVIIQTPNQWPSFKCAHSSHAHLGLQDVIEFFWSGA